MDQKLNYNSGVLREKFDPELQIVDLVNNITNKNEIILFYFFF